MCRRARTTPTGGRSAAGRGRTASAPSRSRRRSRPRLPGHRSSRPGRAARASGRRRRAGCRRASSPRWRPGGTCRPPRTATRAARPGARPPSSCRCPTHPSLRRWWCSTAVLPGGGLTALAAGLFLLRGGAALVRVAALAGLLAAVLGGVRRVGDPGGALLRHPLVLERLVLLLVLDVGRHGCLLGCRRHGSRVL